MTRIPTQAVDPVTAPTTGHAPGCIGLVNLPDGSTGPCPGVAVWDVLTTCETGERKDGPCCQDHHASLVRGIAEDAGGHRVRLLFATPLGGAV